MFTKIKKINGSDYFYLVESQRVEGKRYPVQQMIKYLGNQKDALAKLESSEYPTKEQLLAKVRATVPHVGPNQGKRGRPRKTSDRSGSIEQREEYAHNQSCA